MRQTIRLVVSVAMLAGAMGCSDSDMQPSSATPNFDGNWIGVSRVISCESEAGGCATYAVGDERYLNFLLIQRGDEVTGSLSTSEGGPLALPAAFWIAGRVTSGTLPFQPMEMPGTGSLFSYFGEVTLVGVSSGRMAGRMTEHATHNARPVTLVWQVDTARR